MNGGRRGDSTTREKGTPVDESGLARQRTLNIGGVLLGLGLGGFFDGIVLHQILQWHHMVSSVADYPVTTVDGLEANTLGDGLFHAATYLFTAVGVFLLWRGLRYPSGPWSTKLLVGLLLMGWGTFNLVEGVTDHLILGVHHVNQTAPRSQWVWWDLVFLVWGAAMLVGGWLLARSGERQSSPSANRMTKSGAEISRY